MPDGLQSLGRLLLLMGVILAVIGVLFMISGKIPWLGRLPGDIIIRRKTFTFYFPLATSIILSIVLTLLCSLFRGR